MRVTYECFLPDYCARSDFEYDSRFCIEEKFNKNGPTAIPENSLGKNGCQLNVLKI